MTTLPPICRALAMGLNEELKKREMKKIKNIRVKVTYEVGLNDIEVNSRTYDALICLFDSSDKVDWLPKTKTKEDAFEWLNANIREDDCCELEYDIVDLE
ncbi:Uncharacterised protein [Alistipes sp. cv1]|jgi:hypothetical protein|nr:Uncharacterised protein [Faecalibacterium prausnitzii]